MSKTRNTNVFVVASTIIAMALPGVAQAGSRHDDDCLHKLFRDVDHSMIRVVHHTGRVFKDMFRWCDRRG